MEMWELPTSEDGIFVDSGCFQELLDDFEADLRRDLWTEAAKHDHGDNLQEGGDLWPIVMEQRRLERKGMIDQMALNVTVVAGGQWPRVRCKEKGYKVSEQCPRCKEAPETLKHRVWECSKNVGHEDYSKTDPLIAAALAQADAEPALWLRGLPPTRLTHPLFDDGRLEGRELRMGGGKKERPLEEATGF